MAASVQLHHVHRGIVSSKLTDDNRTSAHAQAQLNRIQYVGTPRNQRSHHIFKGIISASEGDYVSFLSQNLYHNIRNFQTSRNFGATARMKIIRFRGSVTKQAIQGEFKYSQVFPGRNSLFSIA